MNRYEKECTMLGRLAERQLNLPKNRVKENFEGMSSYAIFLKLTEEFNELKDEVMYQNKINYTRVMEELGDCAGMLVAVLAKVNRLRQDEQDDGA